MVPVGWMILEFDAGMPVLKTETVVDDEDMVLLEGVLVDVLLEEPPV